VTESDDTGGQTTLDEYDAEAGAADGPPTVEGLRADLDRLTAVVGTMADTHQELLDTLETTVALVDATDALDGEDTGPNTAPDPSDLRGFE